MNPVLVVHIAAGSVAIIAGFAALFARKGEPLHRAAGSAFFGAMLLMAGFGGIVAIQRSQELNIFAASFTLYLVATAWMTVRRKPGTIGRFEHAALLFISAVAAVGLTFAWQASSGAAAGSYSVFAGLAILAAALDFRMIRRGGVAGADRIARHLWRMCLALFVAAGSFFLGQADEIPEALRGPHLFVPALAPLAAMAFYLVRVRRTSRRTAPAKSI